MPLEVLLTIIAVSIGLWFMNEHVLPRIASRRTPTSWLQSRVRKSITIHLTDDATIDGLLELVTAEGVVLRTARYFESEGEVRLAGEVFIPRSRIIFIQESS